jgi:thiol-disulfide isomerase/thioredoxin
MRKACLTLWCGLTLVAFTAVGSGFEFVGRKAPDFVLRTIDGNETFSLKDLRGNVVVLDFWASWCPPCRRSLPVLAAMEERLKGLKVLAVNIDDDRANGMEFLRRHRIKVTALYDQEKTVVRKYDVLEMPSALIIDKHGVVRFVHTGYSQDDLEQFKKQIEGLL